MFIYKITCLTNGKIYIGQTVKKVKSRFSEHLNSAFDKNEKSLLYMAMRKYGKENFIVEQLCSCKDKITLAKLEKHYIKKYNSQDRKVGYNLLSGGIGEFSKIWDVPEVRENMAKRIPWNRGKKNCQVPWNKGLTADIDSRVADNVKNMNSVASNWPEEKRAAKSKAMMGNGNYRNFLLQNKQQS